MNIQPPNTVFYIKKKLCKCSPYLISWKAEDTGMISGFENRILDFWVGNRDIDEVMGILKDNYVSVWIQVPDRVFLVL